MAESLSLYAASLSKGARKTIYREDISNKRCGSIFGNDFGAEITNDFPPVDASDLLSYLVLKNSFITWSQFKARKSLQAYNQFMCGSC